jgi:hypothetical protein
MIWLMQKILSVIYMLLTCGLHIFLVFDFIQDMTAIQNNDNLFMIIVKGKTTWNFYVHFDHSLYKDLIY